MTKLSIIIPIYNVEQYVSNCLNSILSQPFEDFEVICVNDGSTDNSLAELQKCRDERVLIIDKKNEGSGVARNTALAIARGEYVFFVDGDDWIEENSLQRMVDEADRLKTDILIFGGLSYYEGSGKNGGYSANKLPKKYLNKVFSANDIKKDVFKFPSTAWTKLYRREFLQKNGIKFQEIKVGQDQLPFFHSMITAERIALLPENFYCYRKNRVGSAMTVKKKKNFSPIYVTRAIEELLKNMNVEDDYATLAFGKYFSKATSWLGKFQDDIKPEYYAEYMALLTHLQSAYSGWWKYFNPILDDGYWTLKMKQILAKQKFMLLK